jgi:hypothetical protein
MTRYDEASVVQLLDKVKESYTDYLQMNVEKGDLFPLTALGPY